MCHGPLVATLVELGLRVRLGDGLGGRDHDVADAEVVDVLDTDVGLVVDVAQLAHRVGRVDRTSPQP